MSRNYIYELSGLEDGKRVDIAGWVQDIRKLKNVAFLMVRDNTGIIQSTLKLDNESTRQMINELTRESVIKLTGILNKHSPAKGGMEVQTIDLSLLNRSLTPLPLGIADPVEADFDTRFNNRFLDLRKPERLQIFHVESELLWGIRKFLNSEHFVEVHTPKIVAAATEGGADLFGVKYFEKSAYLNQSPQLYKEMLMSAGFDRVFEVGPAFRAEEHNTPRHLNEFTSIDIEMSFSDHNDAMSMLERSVKAGIESVALSNTFRDLDSTQIEVPEIPFPRISYQKCIDYLHKNDVEMEFGGDFSPEQLKIVGEQFKSFYFITEWPSQVRAFYTMPKEDNHLVTNSFDLQYRDKEITSGAQRIHEVDLLEKRLKEKGLNPADFEFHLKAFRYGMPPHAGWGLGLERLTMILLDLQNIREVSLFPRDRTRIVP